MDERELPDPGCIAYERLPAWARESIERDVKQTEEQRRQDEDQYHRDRPPFAQIKQAIRDFLTPLEQHQYERADAALAAGPDNETTKLKWEFADLPDSLIPAYGASEGHIITGVQKRFPGVPDHKIRAALAELDSKGQVRRTEEKISGFPDWVWRIATNRLVAEPDASETSSDANQCRARPGDLTSINGIPVRNVLADLIPVKSPNSVLADPAEEQPEIDPESLLTSRKLAERFDVPHEALRQRLKRWQKHNSDGWIENADRKSKEAKYLFYVNAVRPVISELNKACQARATAKRPAKKK